MMQPLFNIPLYRYRIPDWQNRKPELMKLLPSRDEKWTDYFDIARLSDTPYLDILGDLIHEPMEDFSEELEVPLVIEKVWCQRSVYGDYHKPHCHGPTGYAAVLYVEFDKNVHKATTFFSPSKDPMTGELLAYCPEDIEEGDLLIFPRSLIHEGPVNLSQKTRSVISFNIMGEDVLKAYMNGINNYNIANMGQEG